MLICRKRWRDSKGAEGNSLLICWAGTVESSDTCAGHLRHPGVEKLLTEYYKVSTNWIVQDVFKDSLSFLTTLIHDISIRSFILPCFSNCSVPSS